jgi:hypothetical protein
MTITRKTATGTIATKSWPDINCGEPSQPKPELLHFGRSLQKVSFKETITYLRNSVNTNRNFELEDVKNCRQEQFPIWKSSF